MMIDLEKTVGFPVKLDESKHKFAGSDAEVYLGEGWKKYFDNGITKPAGEVCRNLGFLCQSMMFARDYTNSKGNVTKYVPLQRFAPRGKSNNVLYFGNRGIFWNDAPLLGKIEKLGLRPDITAIPAGKFGEEFARTQGHWHAEPEVYQTSYGENIYLLAGVERNRALEVLAVHAQAEDVVVIPGGYRHITVNTGTKPLVMVDWMSRAAVSDFEDVLLHNGLPYWVVDNDGKTEFMKNPRWKKHPKIRHVRPVEKIPELGLARGVPIFSAVRGKEFRILADFLKDKTRRYGTYSELFDKAYIDF